MPTLNTTPGSSTKGQRCLLHRIKRKRGWSNDQLHDAIGFASTTDMSVQQASDAIDRLGAIPLANPPGQAPRPDRRKRSDAIPMITPDHVDQIARLGAEYFGITNGPTFSAWLSRNFGPVIEAGSPVVVDDLIRRLGTAERAGQVIHVLREMIRRRNAKETHE